VQTYVGLEASLGWIMDVGYTFALKQTKRNKTFAVYDDAWSVVKY